MAVSTLGSEDQFDRQQVLEQIERRVGLAYAQRCAGAVVLHAEVQRWRVKRGRPSELFEFGERRCGRISQLQPIRGVSAGPSAVACTHPRDAESGAR